MLQDCYKWILDPERVAECQGIHIEGETIHIGDFIAVFALILDGHTLRSHFIEYLVFVIFKFFLIWC